MCTVCLGLNLNWPSPVCKSHVKCLFQEKVVEHCRLACSLICLLASWRIKETCASFPAFQKRRARPGFEPGTSRTLSENHTPRPTSQQLLESHVSVNLLPRSQGHPTHSGFKLCYLIAAGTGMLGRMVLKVSKWCIILFPPGLEPGTLCVWSTRDNHYTTETLLWSWQK